MYSSIGTHGCCSLQRVVSSHVKKMMSLRRQSYTKLVRVTKIRQFIDMTTDIDIVTNLIEDYTNRHQREKLWPSGLHASIAIWFNYLPLQSTWPLV